jgi:endonuclease/exonuclease/phosphatase family metal-dependent hydrolase
MREPGVKLLTWNIQAGIGTGRALDYVIHAHRQLIHTRAKTQTLIAIARIIAPYDVVCLQEIDLGGRRAGFRSQLDTLLAFSGHAHVAVQHNRTVPGISRHGNAILSRYPLDHVRDIKLPGRIGGRGALIADVLGPIRLTTACLHLSLGAAAQALQLAAIAERLRHAPAWVAMGDFNCTRTSAPLLGFCHATGAQAGGEPCATYPAWRPVRDFDHIVAGPGVPVGPQAALSAQLSDHLAIAARVDV